MDSESECAACGGQDVVPGRLAGMGLGFVPDAAPALGMMNATTPITAELCMRCGHIQLRGDRKWVAKVLGRFVPGQP